ncbi:UNVERIFIED_CONTAM: Chloroplast envelope membrane protein [Sesamum latifolium]|uniref:Chloroplast envelope membrane protein n=1 Tax=Sesamum latifolium TaxID=2727402 RepID=A0AAW2VBK2_9LAMI
MGDLVLGREEDDILYEDQVLLYASLKSAKFLAVLVILPWTLDFLVHDYVLVPFLDRYVKTVPLAAQMLDVRKNQKLEMVKALNTEKARYRLEVEIGKSPPLSDEELYMELRNKAIELRDEWRLENRKAFANIWSDMVFGVTLFILLYFYQNQTLLEIIVEHYGFEVDQAAITIFVCLVPVIIDACVKLWSVPYGSVGCDATDVVHYVVLSSHFLFPLQAPLSRGSTPNQDKDTLCLNVSDYPEYCDNEPTVIILNYTPTTRSHKL